MSYDPEKHKTTYEKCPEYVYLPKRNATYICLGVEFHPQPHYTLIEDSHKSLERLEWYTP